MKILIDGYNAIGRISSLKAYFPSDLERGREEFRELLRRFKKVKGHKITVVYDGPGGMWGKESYRKSAGIKEIFTSEMDQADDVIMRMARKDPDGLMVVTADRRVSSACRKAGAAVMSPEDLEDKIMMAVLMEDKGMAEEDFDEYGESSKKGPSKRLSKKKRKELRAKKKI